METSAQLIYTGEKYYQLFHNGRGYNIASGERTPAISIQECTRLIKTGFFSPVDSLWDKIIKNQTSSNYSAIEGMLAGQRCFLIAGGPSICGFDLSKLDNEFTIAINYSYKFYPNSKSVIFCDSYFAEREQNDLAKFSGMIFGSYKCVDFLPKKNNVYVFPLNSKYVGHTFGAGLYNGRLSGLAAINLALLLGAEEIYLLGFDMCYQNKVQHHWYGTAFDAQNTYAEKHFTEKIHLFNAYAPYKDRIFNCSEISKIKIFEHRNIDTVLHTPYNIQMQQRIKLQNAAQKQIVANSVMHGIPEYPVSASHKLSKINGMLYNKRVFVLGSGPSLKNFDLSQLDNEETIAVNHTIEHYTKCKHHLFGDPRVFGYVSHLYGTKFHGNIFASHHANISHFESNNDNVFVFAKNSERVTDKIEDGLYSDFNSGMEAVNLALVMGAKEIYLLGFDFCASDGEYYFYGRPSWFRNTIDQVDSLLEHRVKFWDKFAPYRDRIFNCSTISRINVFEYRNIDEVLQNEKSN